MTPAERKLLEAIARAVATSPGIDLVDALEAMKREAETRCGIIGYPDGVRRTCELALDVPHDYHQEGRIRWIGYYRSPDLPGIYETRDTVPQQVKGIDGFVDELRNPPIVKSADHIRTILLAFAGFVKRQDQEATRLLFDLAFGLADARPGEDGRLVLRIGPTKAAEIADWWKRARGQV